jgi:hypothetical protein
MRKETSLVIALALASCGGPSLDSRGQRLAEAAARTSAALDSTVGSTSLLAVVDVSEGISAGALDDAAQAIDLLLGSCVDAETVAPPARGLDLQFKDGCEIPLTALDLSGGMKAEVVDGNGSETFDVRFRKLELLGLALDGEMNVAHGDDRWSYRFDQLSAGFGDQSITLGGAASASRSWTGATTFDGTGSIATTDETVAFRADGIERGLRDCYPSKGSLAVTVTVADNPPVTATLRFSDDSAGGGKVYLDYDGHTIDYQLPSRLCD